MSLAIIAILAILQFTVINSDTHIGIVRQTPNQGQLTVKKVGKQDCNCDIRSKYIDIVQINRDDIANISIDKVIKKLHATVEGNYKTIDEILCKSKCNFAYVQRGLRNVQQTIKDIIEIFSCPEKRQDKDLLSAAFDIFVAAKDAMIADMRNASKELSQECADLFTKIRPAACNTGENICFTVLNSMCLK